MKPIFRIFLIMGGVLTVGTVGFSAIEGWPLFDAFYMSVITLTTVGYREVHELTFKGQVFTVCYLLAGMGIFFFELAQMGEFIVRGELGQWMGRLRAGTRLRFMNNHFIVCGFGRLGKRLCEELAARKLPFVVIEKDPAVLGPCQEAGWPCIVGDATDDKILQEAGIQNARGLAAVLSSDADNLYSILSARLLSKNIRLLSRATTEKETEKLLRAGANQVISLYATGATKMAQLLVNPNVDDFMEIISSKGKSLDIAQVQVTAQSSCAGKSLAETDLRKHGIIIVGIRRTNGELHLLPGGTDVPYVGDFLIALGRPEAITGLIQEG